MSKKRPDLDKVANELMGGASAFFRTTPQPTKTEPEPTPTVAPAPAITPDPDTSSDVVTSRRHSVMTSSSSLPSAESHHFDINRPTASRDSLRLSPDETKALDDLRQSLKWDFDLTVSKNDICRVALHWLLEDATAKGERSEALKRLKRKQTGR